MKWFWLACMSIACIFTIMTDDKSQKQFYTLLVFGYGILFYLERILDKLNKKT